MTIGSRRPHFATFRRTEEVLVDQGRRGNNGRSRYRSMGLNIDREEEEKDEEMTLTDIKSIMCVSCWLNNFRTSGVRSDRIKNYFKA